MRTLAFVIVMVACTILASYAMRRSREDRELKVLDETYAELKALPPVARDFTTPEGAVLCLEDAYRRRDIEAAVAAKDFRTEARLMLQETGFEGLVDDELVSKTAQTLEKAFRAFTTADWPDVEGLESFFTKREPHADKIVVVTEVCRFPDRRFSTQRMLVAETDGGWRVLNSVSE